MSDLVHMSPATLSKGRLWAALVVILFGQFIVSIDLTVLNIALPDLTKDLKPTSDQLLWIVDVYSLVLAGLLVATSSLSDRFGRKRTLLTGFFLFGVGSLLILFANSPGFVIAIRAFLGVGGALIMPVTVSMIRSIFQNAKERAFAVAAWSAIGALGMATGPLIGGFLLEHFNWHAAFLVNVPLMAAAFVAGIFVLPEVRLKKPGSFDILASLLFLAGMVAFLWGIKHLAAELAFDAQGVVAVVAGLVLLGLFIFRCLRAKTPVVDLSLFRSKPFTAGIIATMGCMFAMATLLYMLSQWLQLVNGDGTLEAGVKLVPMAIASLLASAVATPLAMKLRPRNVVAGGMILAAAAMMMLMFFKDDLELMPVMISTTLVGVGTGALAIGSSLIMCETPVEKASSAGSLQEVSYDLGNVLGVAILGSLASIIYRNGLPTGELRAMGLDGRTIDAAEQSLSATSVIAEQLGLPQLLQKGIDAFNDSVVITCFIGGVIILAVAVVVWALIPRDVKITENEGEADDGGTLPDASDFATANGSATGTGLGSGNLTGAGLAGGSVAGGEASFGSEGGASPLPASLGAPIAPAAPINARNLLDENGDPSKNSAGLACAASAETQLVAPAPGALSIPVKTETLIEMDSVCQELGISMGTAFSLFATKVARERRIPFKLGIDPFYTEENLARLRSCVRTLNEGNGVQEVRKNIRVWAPQAWNDYNRMRFEDNDRHRRIKDILKDIEKNGPKKGGGKPEPLTGELTGLWSQRIDKRGRLVFRLVKGNVEIVSCAPWASHRA